MISPPFRKILYETLGTHTICKIFYVRARISLKEGRGKGEGQ